MYIVSDRIGMKVGVAEGGIRVIGGTGVCVSVGSMDVCVTVGRAETGVGRTSTDKLHEAVNTVISTRTSMRGDDVPVFIAFSLSAAEQNRM
jgi:hypothetical protein